MSCRLIFYRTIVFAVILQVARSDHLFWEYIENVAERHPYVVGLLSRQKHYLCSGVAISTATVLTSGHCLMRHPEHVAVGRAVLNKYMNAYHILDIGSMTIHNDFAHSLVQNDTSETKIRSNLGIVCIIHDSSKIIETATRGRHFVSEMINENLFIVGYGLMSSKQKMFSVEERKYKQTPCPNPDWFYCLCGVEIPHFTKLNFGNFGEGAPVIFNSEVVGVVASPCNYLRSADSEYNVFTIIAPYLPWIEKLNTVCEFDYMNRPHSDDKHHNISKLESRRVFKQNDSCTKLKPAVLLCCVLILLSLL